MLLELQQAIPAPQQQNGLTPEEARKAIEKMLTAAAQMQTIRMGLDITEKEVVLATDIEAGQGTDLSRLFVRSPESYRSFMTGYSPLGQITVRSNSYDVKGMFDFFNNLFGEFYKNIGMDLAMIEPMAVGFTGEAAGGISFRREGIDIEMIAVRKDAGKPGETFLESEYLPWLMDYGRNITAMLNQADPALQTKNLFSKTPETVIDGHRVFGLKGEIPVTTPTFRGMDRFGFDMRIAAVDFFVLTASSDERLKKLIQVAKTLKQQPASGPLMRAEMDLGSCMQAFQSEFPGFEEQTAALSKLQNLVYTVDMTSGCLTAEYRMRLEDIKALASSFKGLGELPPTAGAEYSAAGPSSSQARPLAGPADERLQPPSLTEDDPRYWLNQGLLFATYGNDKEAIKHFKKSIHMDPENPSAYFNLGLSYSGMGEYEKAIAAISRAIALSPENGDYYYGRGWVLQFSGDQAAGFTDIQKAAELGSMDARTYLEGRTGEQIGR